MKALLLKITTIAMMLGSQLANSQMVGAIPVDKSLYANREVLPDALGNPQPPTEKALIHIKGNLYRHTNDKIPSLHSGLVLINKEGALVIDPANTQSAEWLLNEIKTRFNVPVKYLIMTHAHYDHIGGSQVFQNAGAKVIIQEKGLEPIIGEKLPTAVPDYVYKDHMEITMGGEKILLDRVAPSHSNSMTVVRFPAYKAMQLTDVGQNETFPYNDFLDFYYDGWIETLDFAIAQNYDIIDIGHYTPTTTEFLKKEREYMVSLHDQVLDLLRKGYTWDELYRNVKFTDEQKKWFGYDSMSKLNILGMFRWMVNHRRGVW
ncbi:MBL fold metallo-hydrolase [Bergeyella porcorum]